MINPTIGRVVLFWPSRDDFAITSGGDQPLPALICHVWSDTCINIAGFDANGNHFSRTSVYLHQEDHNRPGSFFAEWMPYQKQVAKTEAAQADRLEQAV